MEELSTQEKAKTYDGEQNSVNTELDELVIQLEEAIGTSPHSRETIKDFFQKAVQKYMNCLKIANGEIGALVEENYRLKEKQGDEVEPKFHEGDKIKLAKEPKYPEREIIAIKNGAYYFDKLVHLPFSRQDEWELVEQKPADEVEPKFKVGDWIVYNRNDSSREILYVYDIRDGRYYFNDNIHFSWSVKECDEKCHLWTIDDVKDGDVVAQEPFGTYEKPFVAIYKGRGLDHFVSYCFTSFDGKFNEGTGGHCLNVHLATKEQCEQLEKAMAEAGYTFDFEKKELKKIGQNTAWSEDDETKLITAKTFIVNTSLVGNDEMKEATIDWVNGLKNRVQSKSEWGEEDETKLITAKTFIVNTSLVGNDGIKEATIEWLNDLKNRVQPKPAWSEEDERQFSIIIRHCYLKRNLYKKENNKEYAQTCQGLIDWLEAIKQRAELAVDNPNEKAMVKYLFEKKGYPICLNGNLVSYEEAMETANRYINYKKEKFIEKACEWMKDNITYTHPRKGTKECVVNLEKFKDYMKGE